MLTDTDRLVWLDSSGLALLDSRIGGVSVISLGTGDTFSDLNPLEGNALGERSRDVGILNDDEGWICLLYSPRSGHSGDTSVAAGLN